ncbi:M1 family peptidase [bacterium]|nr:MAG: M1 family peptidase [bacterium]
MLTTRLLEFIIIPCTFCLIAILAVTATASQPKPIALSHKIAITVNLKERAIIGTDAITLNETGGTARLLIRKNSTVYAVESNGKRLSYKTIPLENYNEILITLPESGKSITELNMAFGGTFQSIESARGNITRGVAFVDDGVIGDEGAFLPSSSLWYPQTDDAVSASDLTITLPHGFSSVSEGELAKLPPASNGSGVQNRWKSTKPLRGLDLVVGRYIAEKETYKGIDIYTYFFKKDDELSRLYIEKTKAYLDFYNGLAGTYPFGKFAVVESFLPTGYGMPSFTLLGSSVIRLPFIPDTSLGHEIAHNWWGNSVFVDEANGNWSEAITTYTADYLYAEKKGANDARDFRLSKLRGYKNFAGEDAVSLKNFSDSTTPTTRAVGYNKGVMVFHMLRNALGNETFAGGLKEFYSKTAFKKASWQDIQTAFEKASGKDLTWFFTQWIERQGGPVISIDGVSLSKEDTGYTVRFNIREQKPAYIMTVPVIFVTHSGVIKKETTISKEENKAVFELDSKPLTMEIDPYYENFRILSSEEMPPSFGAFFGDKNGVIILPSEKASRDRYVASAGLISKDFGQTIISDDDPLLADYIKNRSVFILGSDGENRAFTTAKAHFEGRLITTKDSVSINGKVYGHDGAYAIAVKNSNNLAKTVCVFAGIAKGAQEMLDSAKRLRYFSEESFVVFTGAGKPEKGQFGGSPPPGYVF